MELLGKIPTEIWVVIATAVVGAIGWFGTMAFNAWRKSRVPFKQDRDRYEAVMSAIEPSDLFYFKDPDYSCIPKRHLDGVSEAAAALSELHKPQYLNKKFTQKENVLATSLKQFGDLLALKCFPNHRNQNVFTIYWDTFDEWKNEDQDRASEIQREIKCARDKAITAFENYRDYGNKLFADRLERGKSDG